MVRGVRTTAKAGHSSSSEREMTASEGCPYGCEIASRELGRTWHVRFGNGAVLAACAHASWFDDVALSTDAHRRMWLSGAAVGLREYAKGRAVLHGSAVSYRGVGVSIVGTTHVGKSTLAAWLCQRGWGFSSDAMTVVDPTSLSLVSQLRRIRLYDDSLRAVGVAEPKLLPFDDQVTGKRELRIDAQVSSPTGTRLLHVVVLERGEGIVSQNLHGADATMTLVQHCYLASRLSTADSGRLLVLASHLVGAGLRVHRLTVPEKWSALPDAQKTLECLVTGHGDGAGTP